MMLNSYRHSLSIALLALMFTAAGCSTTPPPVERDLAREAIMAANRAGARKMAIEEYREAYTTYDRGEALIEDGEVEEAQKILIEAMLQAHYAEATAYIRSLNLAENRIRQLEIQKSTLLQAWREAIADQEATIDFKVQEEEMPSTELTNYTVTDGENLFAIAGKRKVYGDALLWPLIYKANRDQIKDPKQIYPGQLLTIPRDVTELEMEEARKTARESTIFQAGATNSKSK